jgi:hypothetical protein
MINQFALANIRCGMDAWLVKPTNRSQIVDAVQHSISTLSVV